MQFNHQQFFHKFKIWYTKNTGLELTAEKVAAVDFILTQIEAYPQWKRVEEAAYLLATVHIETFWPKTGQRYEPIREGGGKAYCIKRYWTRVKIREQLGNLSEYDAWARSGRGYVQQTGLDNDKRADRQIRKQLPEVIAEFESRTGQVFDLIKYPEQVLDPHISFAALTLGMKDGWFTGKKLGDYINGKGVDFKGCRRVINGQDRAQEIAELAEELVDVFRSGLISSALPASVAEPATTETNISDHAEEVPRAISDNTPVAAGQPTSDAQLASVPPTKDAPPQELTKERPSIWVKIGALATAAIGFFTNLGVNIGTLLQGKLENITPNQIFWLLIGLGLIALALWFYDRSAKRANVLNIAKMQHAADKTQTTVELKT